MAQTYTPGEDQINVATEAFGDLEDPIAYGSRVDKRWDAKYGANPAISMLLALRNMAMSNGHFIRARNETGAELAKGTLVYRSGYDADDDMILISKADADDKSKLAEYVLDADLANNTNGIVYAYKTVTGDATDVIDTSGRTEGDLVYTSGTAGEFAFSAGANSQVVGQVEVVSATVGVIMFWPGGYVGEGQKALTTQSRRGHIDGLRMANGTDTDHDIDIASGECTGSKGSLLVLSSITKQIDANWAEGTGAGGFPSGLTLSNTTWYHVFLIRKDDGTIDAGFDTSLTAANLLSDASTYSEYRRIGSVLTDGSANILGFSQDGDEVLWDDPPLDFDSTITTSRATIALSTPLGVVTRAIISTSGIKTAAQPITMALAIAHDDEAPGVVASPVGDAYAAAAGEFAVGSKMVIRTNTASQIAARAHITTVSYRITTFGYMDPRGRNA